MANYPDWFKPFLKDDSFDPDLEFVENLEPQSRVEALLKFLILGQNIKYEGFNVVEESGTGYIEFYDLDGKLFNVKS